MPCLAELKSTSIPLPAVVGVTDTSAAGGKGELVTVAEFLDEVTVLATKTRPKKLRMLGSDGHTYMFLLKVRRPCRDLKARLQSLL